MHLRDFATYKAVARLTSLAGQPYDLTGPRGLTPARIESYICSGCGYDLLFATQRVDDDVMAALQDLADEAGLVDAFMAMKQGAVLNRIEGFESENRQVLHTACRDVFAEEPLAVEASRLARQELAKLRRFLADLENGHIVNAQGEPFTTMVQVGIGGSDLGPRALYLALQCFCLEGRSARNNFV